MQHFTNKWWIHGFDINVLVPSLDAAGKHYYVLTFHKYSQVSLNKGDNYLTDSE